MDLIEETLTHHLYSAPPAQAGPHAGPNLLRLVERHFISQIPATASKQASRELKENAYGVQERMYTETHVFGAASVCAVCLNECFEVYHTYMDFLKDVDEVSDYSDNEYLSHMLFTALFI